MLPACFPFPDCFLNGQGFWISASQVRNGSKVIHFISIVLSIFMNPFIPLFYFESPTGTEELAHTRKKKVAPTLKNRPDVHD